MSKTYVEIYKLCKKYTKEEKPHMLTYYGGGHGVTNEEQQFITVNSNDPKTAVYPIQFKLEYIAASTDCVVGCFFDCCRVPVLTQSAALAAPILGKKQSDKLAAEFAKEKPKKEGT